MRTPVEGLQETEIWKSWGLNKSNHVIKSNHIQCDSSPKSVAGKWPKGQVLANPRNDTLHHWPLCSSSLEQRDLPSRKKRQTAGNGIPVPTETSQPSRRHSLGSSAEDQAPLPKAHPAVWITFLLSGENTLTDQHAWRIVYPSSLFKGTQLKSQ